MVSRASEELQARIDGPRWQISPTNPIRLKAATQAAVNARHKAEAYAAGVGAKLGQLIDLSEPDSFTGHGGIQLMSSAGGAGGEMPIETGEHHVLAAIHATFELRLP